MGDYNIDINVNMGGSAGNFQDLIASMNNLNASFQKVGTASKAAGDKSKQSFGDAMDVMVQYENSTKKVVAEIDRLKKAIIDENDALKKKTITDTQHKQRVDQLHSSLKTLQGAQRQYNSLLGQTSAKAGIASKSLTVLTASFNKLGAVLGISFGLYGIFRGLTSVIKTISEFDLAQRKLRSVLGETAKGMEILSKSAITLGKSSIFGAKGVSELQIVLAKMGFSKNEIMAMQGAINDLAIATQEDLAGAAETVANVIRTFNLTATETRDVVNVMGKAFNATALGLDNFRESIKYVAPVAHQAGLSFRETVAALGLLSNAGLKGSLAGTGLNNVLKAMMDSNSKLSKQMGGTVQGWEGFVSVMQRAREEGWNMQDVFGLITQRATGAFSTIMNGLPTLQQMTDELEDVSNVMRDQAGVQLDSIAYKAKLVAESWNAMMIEFDKGNNIVSSTIKTTLTGFSQWMFLISGNAGQVTKDLIDSYLEIREAISLEGIDGKLKENLKKVTAELLNTSQVAARMSKKQLAEYMPLVLNIMGKSSELLSSVIVKASDEMIKSLKIEGKTFDEWESSRQAALLKLSSDLKNNNNSLIQQKVLLEAIQKIDKLNFQRASDTAKASEDGKKAIQDKYKYEIALLKAQQALEAEKIKMINNSYLESILLAENEFKFKKLILEKELEMNISLGENKVKFTKLTNKELLTIQLDYSNNIIGIFEKANKSIADAELKLIKQTMKRRTEASGSYQKDFEKRMEALDKFMDKFRFDNPILAKIFGQDVEEGLFAGLFTEEEAKQFAAGFKTAFGSIGDSLGDYVSSWVTATDRIVDQLNRQVDETQAALNTEVALMAAGYASNVTLKKKELDDLKKVREEALIEQKKAQKAQIAAETITQLSSLITASAQIFKGVTAVMPVIGIPIAIGLIAAMFGAFSMAKAKAMQTAGVTKFEKGGWIGGERHSRGGTHIEAERGEFVVRRNSAIKHKSLIEAINSDNQYEMNRIYLNKVKGQIFSGKVSLDDSKDLKAIRALMEKQGKTVEYSGSYRIEKVGNITTKIRLN